MRKTFQKWLFVFIASAFAVTFAISFLIQTRQARDNALNLIRLKIADARRQLTTTEDNLRRVTELTSTMALGKARALARLVELSPSMLSSPDELEQARLLLDVDELHVSDARGILIASIPRAYEGYDMASATQSAAFLPALTDPSFGLVQAPQPKGIDQQLFQYAGVARRDASGIVQIGYHPRRLQEAAKLADIRSIAAGFRIGSHGSIMICRGQEVLSYCWSEFGLHDLLAAGLNRPALLQKSSFDVTVGGLEYVGVAQEHHGYRIIGLLPKNEMYISRNAVIGVLVLVNVLLFVVVFVLVSILVQRIVIDGIYQVNSSLERITGGDLEVKVDVENSNEFRALSEGINSTVAALKRAIRETAARIDAELKFAHAIQVSMLPEPSPDFPDHPQFRLCAVMHTAREVGGDFYDYQVIDGDHVCFLVADVSGKGIPAALFMMTSKMLLHNLAASGLPAAAVFTEGNRQICENNEAGMFVTAWMGILELSSGRLECVNAGHNPPLLKRCQGGYDYLRIRPGLVLGGMDNVTYRSHQVVLAPGDRLILYTDGVTEAQNPAGQLWGEDRLVQALPASVPADAPLSQILAGVKAAIDAFAQGASQADDITMLTLEYRGPTAAAAAEVTLAATVENVLALQEFVGARLAGLDTSAKVRNQVQVAAEEVFVNIARYAYAGGAGAATVSFRSEPGPPARVVLQFRDRGVPFDPLARPAPDVTLPAEERPVGGLGIYLVRKSMDAVDYQYVDGQNVLTISRNL